MQPTSQTETAAAATDAPPATTQSAAEFRAELEAKGFECNVLPAGKERLVTVSYTAMQENYERERKHVQHGTALKLVPGVVLRERQPDGTLNIIGVYRHVFVNGDSTMEYLADKDRFQKTDGNLAVVAQRSTGEMLTFTHPKDEKISGMEDWIKIGC